MFTIYQVIQAAQDFVTIRSMMKNWYALGSSLSHLFNHQFEVTSKNTCQGILESLHPQGFKRFTLKKLDSDVYIVFMSIRRLSYDIHGVFLDDIPISFLLGSTPS